MSMDMRKAEAALAEAAPASVASYLGEFGFKTRAEHPRIYVAQSQYCLVRIELDWIVVNVTVKALSGDPSVEYQEVQVDICWVHSPEEIRGEVDRQLYLLVQWHKNALQGDFTDWPTV